MYVTKDTGIRQLSIELYNEFRWFNQVVMLLICGLA